MNSDDFSNIVKNTKKVVLSAIHKSLAERFLYAIDDVVQETYIKAYKSLSNGKFRGESELSTYLYKIARNESLKANKSLEKEERKLEKLKNEPLQNSDYKSIFSMERIMKLIGIMPDPYAEVLQRQIQGKSFGEISVELGISGGTVKSRAFRGREFIRKNYPKGGQNES